jgi:hypothetical protein
VRINSKFYISIPYQLYICIHGSVAYPVQDATTSISISTIFFPFSTEPPPLYVVTWRLKAGIAEPERKSIASQMLQTHVPATTDKFIARQRFGKHVFVTTNNVQGYAQATNNFHGYALDYKSGRADKNESRQLRIVSIPRGGGVEYLHRSPASHGRRQRGKSRIWYSKILSRVPPDSEPRMIALARTSNNCKRRPVFSSERAPYINKPVTVRQ